MKLFKKEPLKIAVGGAFFGFGIAASLLSLEWVSLILLTLSMLVTGLDVMTGAVRGILRRDVFDEKLLMTVAAVGALCIGEALEGAAVLLFFAVGEYFEHKAVGASRRSIRALMDICPDTANVLSDGEEHEEDAEDVTPGSIIIIRSGERVPIDCEVMDGKAELDTSALTGEHLPIYVQEGSTLMSGTVVIGGVLTCRTLRYATESSAARILELVESANERKSREESFITKFSRVYTPAVLFLAVIMAFIPPIFGILCWTDAVYRALSFLVVSCPCALVISVPMAFFGGIGGAASHGILFKGGNVFSPISRLRSVVFDKTGTLTEGSLYVTDAYSELMSEAELISLAASAEYGSRHPIAEALLRISPSAKAPSEYKELVGRGVLAIIDGEKITVGNLKLMSDEGITLPNGIGAATLYVAKNGKYIGSITLSDSVKAEARGSVESLLKLGATRTAILSGDRESSVKTVAVSVGIKDYRAGLLPDEKYSLLEDIIKETRGSTVYVGDGINDAPCIARADVGISMGSLGSDSAIEASDVVIMSDDLSRIPLAVKIARKTLMIAKENIFFALGVKLAVLGLVSSGLAGMWMAVFADVGVAVLAILNSMRALVYSRNKKASNL